MVKNIVLAVAGVLVVAVGVLAYTQYSWGQDQSKKLGMAELAVFCYEDLSEWLVGKGDVDDHVAALDICERQLSDNAKSLIPKH